MSVEKKNYGHNANEERCYYDVTVETFGIRTVIAVRGKTFWASKSRSEVDQVLLLAATRFSVLPTIWWVFSCGFTDGA